MLLVLLKTLLLSIFPTRSLAQLDSCIYPLSTPVSTKAFLPIANISDLKYAIAADRDLILINKQNLINTRILFHDSAIYKLAQIGDYLLATSELSPNISIYNLISNTKSKFTLHRRGVRDVSVFPGFILSATSIDDGTLLVWNVATLTLIRSIVLNGNATKVVGMYSKRVALLMNGYLEYYFYDNDTFSTKLKGKNFYGAEKNILIFVRDINMLLVSSNKNLYVELLKEDSDDLISVAKYYVSRGNFIGAAFAANKRLFFFVLDSEVNIVKFEGLTYNDTIIADGLFLNSFGYSSPDDFVYLLTDRRIIGYDLKAWPAIFSGEECMKCPSLCQVCDSANQPYCRTCSISKSYYFYGFCPSSCPSNSNYNISSASCECSKGYYAEQYMGVQFQCSLCPNYCKQCTNKTYCLECNSGYRLTFSNVAKTRMCSSCPSNCQTCQANNNCLKCNDGFILLNSGVCSNQNSISICNTDEFFNIDTAFCSSCDIACNTCFGASNEACFSCRDGWSFSENYVCKERNNITQENNSKMVTAVVASCCCGFLLLLFMLYLIIKIIDRRSRRVTMLSGNDLGGLDSNRSDRKSRVNKTIPTAVAVIPTRVTNDADNAEGEPCLESKICSDSKKIIIASSAEGENLEEKVVDGNFRHIYYDPLQIDIRPPAGIKVYPNDE